MKLKNLQWRNIKSFGNKMQHLELSDAGGLWMVNGKNGYGKSSLLDMPKILYYGKLDKFKKDDIANRINKHGYIKGTIEVNPGTEVEIERFLAPSELKVSRNGEDIGKAGISNYQDYIDIEVIGLPYHIFSNIISLSVNDFKSFISMTPNDKRIIIDKLFSMEVLNKMYDLIKKDLRNVKTNLDGFDREIKSLQGAILNAQKELEKLKEQVKENNTKMKKTLEDKMALLKIDIETHQKTIETYRSKDQEIKAKYDLFLQQRSALIHGINEIHKKIELFDQDKCPTCSTKFNDSKFNLVKGELRELKQKKEKEFNELKQKEPLFKEAFKNISESIKNSTSLLLDLRSSYNTFVHKLNEINAHTPDEFKSISNIISKNTISIKDRETKKTDLDDELKYLNILEELYSDSGVKKKILESYLPTLNREIEFSLTELHFPYKLTFNNDFEPHLSHLGLDINVETLSTGEKKRVDLAVLISIIRMLKRKYPALNIFMLDEVLSSIDSDGIYDIIGLLRKTAKEMSINIFIINHSPLPIEHFDFKIEIVKNDGFSDLSVEELT